MTEQIRGGTARPIDRGLIERVSQKLRATFEVWFGPRIRSRQPTRGRGVSIIHRA